MSGARTNRRDDLTLVYLHLPKTAGSTMGAILERNFTPEETYGFSVLDPEPLYRAYVASPEEERARYRLIRGHMPFGIHEHVPGPMTYFTVLRDPAERAISMYYQILRTPDHPLYREVAEGGISLEAFVFDRWTFRADNLQTRLLSGVPDAIGHVTAENELVPPAIGYGQCTRELLDRARRNLDEHFSVVGTTERLDETLIVLSRTFGFGVPYSRRRNVGRHRAKAPDPKLDRIRAFLREDNPFDLELWSYANERLERSLATLGSRSRADLRLLTWANHLANARHPLARGVRASVRQLRRLQGAHG